MLFKVSISDDFIEGIGIRAKLFISEGIITIPNKSVCVGWDFLKRDCE